MACKSLNLYMISLSQVGLLIFWILSICNKTFKNFCSDLQFTITKTGCPKTLTNVNMFSTGFENFSDNIQVQFFTENVY